MIIYLNGITKPYVCAFDIEHDQGRLLQFAGILFKSVGTNLYQICKSVNFYLKKERLSAFFEGFTNIDLEFIKTYGISNEEAQQTLAEFIGDVGAENILFVSHGVTQDYMTLKENGFGLGDTELLCTYELAKEVLDRKSNLSANDVALECGYFNPCSHNAYGDAVSTIIILSYLLKKKGEL